MALCSEPVPFFNGLIMPRYRLRTLLILLAVGPPIIAGGYWTWKEWTRPPTAWGGMLGPNETYGFAAHLDGTSPTISVSGEWHVRQRDDGVLELTPP